MNARARAGDVTLLRNHLGGVCRREGGDDLLEARIAAKRVPEGMQL
jgi:hypothetical protein